MAGCSLVAPTVMPGPREARATLIQTQWLQACCLGVEGDDEVGGGRPEPGAVCVWQLAVMPSPDSGEVMAGFA